MKLFDLEKALVGEPVKLRNGDKAFVFKVLQNKNLQTPLIGYHINSSGAEFGITWQINGDYSVCTNENDIIGMWEEPRPRVQLDLPAPLENVEKGQEVYYLELGNQFSQVSKFNFNEDNPCAFQLYKNGGLFATKEDAQEWLDAMKGARR